MSLRQAVSTKHRQRDWTLRRRCGLLLWGLLSSGTARSEEVLPAIPVLPLEEEAATGSAPDAALEEIVVTAQRREQSLQQTPISIAAFGRDGLEQRGIDSVDDLAVEVAGLSIEPFPTNQTTLRLFIRGIGITDVQITQDPPVGVYVDGVYVARSTALALDIADLERIELLRGPQGTLYGRNTTGGAINLITRRPEPGAFSMQHQIGIAERNGVKARSQINLPLGGQSALKLAALHSEQDGYVDNTGPGRDFGDRRDQGVKLDLRTFLIPGVTVDLSAEHFNQTRVNPLYQAVLRPESNKGPSTELFKPFAEANTVYASERLNSLATGAPMEASTARVEGQALTLAWDLGWTELKYIGAHRRLRDATYADLGGGLGSTEYRLDTHAYDGPAADAANGGPTPLVIPLTTQQQLSHELQLSGLLFNERLRYVGGLFWFNETAREERARRHHQLSTALSPSQLTPVLDRLPGDLGNDLIALAGPRLVNFATLDVRVENRALAAFGELTWTPPVWDDRLSLTAGYRRSEDRRVAIKSRTSETFVEGALEGEGRVAFPLSEATPFDAVRGEREDAHDAWTLIGAFSLTPDLQLYAKASEAYRSGGFNARDPQVSGDEGPASDGIDYGVRFVDGFAPETVLTFETGIKSEWSDRRLRINTSGFFSRYRDMQINFLIGGSVGDTKVLNAGRAELSGLELETTLRLTSDLTLSIDYAYLDAEVIEVIDRRDGSNVASRYPFATAPRHSGVLAADWRFARTPWGELRSYVTLNAIARRKGLNQPGREGNTFLPGYALLNARLSAANIAVGREGSLDLALSGRNLLDRDVPVVAIEALPQADRAVIFNEPRTFGVEMILRF